MRAGLRWFGRLLLDSVRLLPWSAAAAVRGPRLAGLLTLPLGVLALLVALFATLNEVRVILLYGLTDGGSIGPGTWGGPTLAGAWAVHAVLGVLLFPVFVGVLAGIRVVADRARDRLTGEPAPGWAIPAALALDVAAVAFLVAFVRQL